jgi:poly-gamma-glutamate synthesis protein (capsule biosynthesis protein)
MQRSLIAAGDVNLMNVADPSVPFRRIASLMADADVRLANLECCLYDTPADHSLSREGFYAPVVSGPALKAAGFDLVGNANNVNYGAEAIRSSCAELDRLGIAHTGAGVNAAAAYAPAVVERDGVRYGLIQRTSVYWPVNHAATDASPGVAVLQGNTAYQPRIYRNRPDMPPINRPGLPPVVVTWADPASLARYRDEVAQLRERCDILVAAHHWGLAEEVLDYQIEIAHAAIDAGADLVVGHGPHYSLGVEFYRSTPVFYGLGSFSFHMGHGGRKHADWRGEMARVVFDGRKVVRAAFSLVRHNEANETERCPLDNESATIARLQTLCDRFGTRLQREQEELVVIGPAQ